jgi:hypothetical protein
MLTTETATATYSPEMKQNLNLLLALLGLLLSRQAVG